MSPNVPVTAEEEYSKDPEIKKEDIEQLKSWIEKQPHLPKPDEKTLILFYHASEYSLQRSKELLETHYTFRTDTPEFFSSPDYEPPRYKYNVPDVSYMMLLPELSPEGYRIVYSGFRDIDPAKFHFEDAVPVRVKAVHVINVTPIIDKVMFLTKPFIKKALFDILYFHSDMNEFYKRIPKNCLPSDLGGTLSTRSEIAEETIQMMEQNIELVNEDFKVRTDESKRQNSSAVNRMEGSFKKIEID